MQSRPPPATPAGRFTRGRVNDPKKKGPKRNPTEKKKIYLVKGKVDTAWWNWRGGWWNNMLIVSISFGCIPVRHGSI